MTTSKKASQKSIVLPLRSVHHTSFLGATFACHERLLSTTHRLVAQNAIGLPFLEISHYQPPTLQLLAGEIGVVAGVEVEAPPYGQSSQRVSTTPSRVGARRGGSWLLAGALGAPKSMPKASTAVERLMSCLPVSTGLLPAFSPPQGALLMQQSTATSESSRPTKRC